VLGVVPFLRDLMLDQEDSLDMVRHQQTSFASDRINIAVILLPHMSNFTDFNALAAEDDVALKYVTSPAALDPADVVIIPGSKNTLADLSHLREKGFAPLLDNHLQGRRELIGICGGYQMLGRRITDPDCVEQGGNSCGLGYLNTETELTNTKYTAQIEAHPMDFFPAGQGLVRGYQIHMGITLRVNELPCFRVHRHSVLNEEVRQSIATHKEEFDGAIRHDGLVWGTYIHGVFDEPGFRHAWLNHARVRKGLPPLDIHTSTLVTSRLQGELDRWADQLSSTVDLSCLLR
jgi:adenosylcobyric acid synthase